MRGTVMVKGQMAAQDEHSSETCLRDEINDVVQKAGQEKADPVALAAFLEEAGTWYYVVDCATCKAVVPFKYAPEGEPIVCFPTMNVRCFECNTDHTYAADLISHRKAAAAGRIRSFTRGGWGCSVNFRQVQALFQQVATCRWIAEHRGLLVTGPCVVGKSWLLPRQRYYDVYSIV